MFITVDSAALSLSPSSITTDPVVNQPYSQQFTASGGIGPYTFSVTLGALPPGLSLSSSGLLAGTPTHAGTYSFRIHVEDSAGSIADF